jgi:hypothetical protein
MDLKPILAIRAFIFAGDIHLLCGCAVQTGLANAADENVIAAIAVATKIKSLLFIIITPVSWPQDRADHLDLTENADELLTNASEIQPYRDLYFEVSSGRRQIFGRYGRDRRNAHNQFGDTP